jgi:hypothetical protein
MKLWKEYAIEPSLFANYHLGNEILAGIGIEHGRIVGALPRRWEREVRRATVGQRDLERRRVEERLLRLKDAIIPRQLDWNGDRSWRDQAFEAHGREPFDCILIGEPDPHPAAVDATLGLDGVRCWEAERRLIVPRFAENLAVAVRPILCQARTVIIVDAYFNPSEPMRRSKWLPPIQALAATLAIDGRLRRFEVHALDPRDERRRWGNGMFSANCRANLVNALPHGLRLAVMLWRERNDGLQFHERLIVTDIGGVVVDPGIDEGQDGETYTLRLLSNREIPEYLAKFAPATAPYDLVEDEVVIGI